MGLFTPRITRRYLKNRYPRPCYAYKPNGEDAIYNYNKLLGFWGLTISEFLYLPIPFQDKMWVLDYCQHSFLAKIGGEALRHYVRSNLDLGMRRTHLWGRCWPYPYPSVSTESNRGDNNLPTPTDIVYIEEILKLLEECDIDTGRKIPCVSKGK